MAMSYFAGVYDAAVEIVGISSFMSFLANTAPYRRSLRISEYGDRVKDIVFSLGHSISFFEKYLLGK